MKDSDLKEIEERCNKATAGPWISFIEGRDHSSGSNVIQTMQEDIEIIAASNDDQDFIAHARQDIPLLLNEIYRLKKLLGESIS
jgi:hypothetical protein